MARRIYAKRYAQAVFEIALERNELDRWHADLEEITRLGKDATLVAWLETPKVPLETKAQFVTSQFTDVNPLALNLVYLLAVRGRLGTICGITDEYQRLFDSHRGIERAEVTTAVSLGDEQAKLLAEGLADVVGKKVVVKSAVDASIVGGFVARIGDKLLDGSTRSRLEALKRELAASGG